jgi:2-succinyl-5-enolpyruvyl-6-hydroxy-3-cyclohexene-1-carboxylate synthase
MKHPKIPLAQTIVSLCKAKQIEHIIISPGSRNAPLTIGFTHDDYFKCYSIVDERCAAFFALGIAQQIQKPTAIICTSGSALLNYYPAIAEAYYSDIPLVVISADRPEYLVGIGDGQTINQKHVFKNHCLYNANLKQDLNTTDDTSFNQDLPIFKNLENKLEKLLGLQLGIQEHNENEINAALNIAILNTGPVHINAPFDEPLYEISDNLLLHPKNVVPDYKEQRTNPEALITLLDIWNSAKKKLVLVGVSSPNKIEQQWLDKLANDDSVIVFTETTSNVHHEAFFPSIDKIIAPLSDEEFKNLQPNLLLTLGGLVVSKKVKAFLRNYRPQHHWHIDEKKANDTFFSLTSFLQGNVNLFFEQLFAKIENKPSSYKKYWKEVKEKRAFKHDAYLNTIDFSDLKVFEILLKSIPDFNILQLGNSSTIRYTQLFDLNKTLEVYCNRGTSGIDGNTSTAIGCAVVNSKQTVLITGDLSFFYDSNALWNAYIPNNFRVIVVNNGGGGIFRILPGHKNTKNFDTYFETKHDLTASHLCEMYNFEYLAADNEKDLKNTLETFFQETNSPKLLEVFTPGITNDGILLDYFKFIQ